MYIPTEKTQAKLREIIHAQICNAFICKGPDVDWDRSPCHRLSAVTLGLLMPTISAEMFPAVREDERTRVMDRLGLVPSSYDNCPGGHECGCAADALDAAYRAVESPQADAVTLS